jgi:hypothetical protein
LLFAWAAPSNPIGSAFAGHNRAEKSGAGDIFLKIRDDQGKSSAFSKFL